MASKPVRQMGLVIRTTAWAIIRRVIASFMMRLGMIRGLGRSRRIGITSGMRICAVITEAFTISRRMV